MILHGYHICPSFRVNGKEEVVCSGILCHQNHPFHLVAYPVQVSIDAVGQCQPFIPVQQVLAVILFFGSGLSLQRIGNPGIVHDIDEVADQLLCFRYKIAEFVQTEQFV